MDNKVKYNASQTVAITLASLASSATLVAGRSSALIDNTTDLVVDRPLTLKIKTGTTPTVGQIEFWAIPVLNDTPAFFDVFDGTDKAVTVTTRGMLESYGILLNTIQMDSTTTGLTFSTEAPLIGKWGGIIPPKYQIFVTHNLVAALDATGGSHVLTEKPAYFTTT